MFIVGVVGANAKEYVADRVCKILKHNKQKASLIDFDAKSAAITQLQEYVKVIESNQTDFLILCMQNSADCEVYLSGIYFDVIAYVTSDNDNEEDVKYNNSILLKKLKAKSITIINADNEKDIKQIEGIKTCIITYGFNTKATITSSSIDDNSNSISICQQRALKTLKSKLVEPQEFILNIKKYNTQNIYNALVIASLCLIFGIGSIESI